MNSLPKTSRNLVGHARSWCETMLWRSEALHLAEIVRKRFDVVHFNHEGLGGLAGWLCKRHDKAQTMHVRTMIPNNAFGRWQCRRMASCIDRFAFITENERENFEKVFGGVVSGSVIYNVATDIGGVHRHSAVPRDRRLKVAVLSNYAYVRGVDRAVEIAQALTVDDRQHVLFVVAGDMSLRGSLPGELGRIARASGTLADYAVAKGVAKMFLFLGHVAVPETVLAACDILLKPTREDNPWGRDIIEALAAGLPVLSIGQYQRFVETGQTGILMPTYSAAGAAEHLLKLHSDRALLMRLGTNARTRIAELCDGPSRARDLLEVWRAAVDSRRQRAAA